MGHGSEPHGQPLWSRAGDKKYVTALQIAGVKPATVERAVAEKEAELEAEAQGEDT